MRLFVALRFPEEVLDAMTALEDAVRAESRSGNFSRRENLHLTLSFLGETAPDRVPVLRTLLKETAGATGPFSLVFDQLDYFPGRRGERLWYLSAPASQDLTDLAGRLQTSLRRLGFPQEERAFVPHVTLGRRCVPRPEAGTPRFRPIPFRAGAMDLMLSERQKGVLTYTPLYTAKFSK